MPITFDDLMVGKNCKATLDDDGKLILEIDTNQKIGRTQKGQGDKMLVSSTGAVIDIERGLRVTCNITRNPEEGE